MDKRHIILLSILILICSVSTVNAVSKTIIHLQILLSPVNSSVDGNSVVKSVTATTTNSISRDVKEIKITEKNYSDYFNVYTGQILSSADIILVTL
jgi:hypothetical protein